MGFLNISDFFRVSWGNSNNYTTTGKFRGTSIIREGQPEFLNPESLNPYDLYMTTAQLYAVIQRRGHMLASGVWKHYDKDGEEIENSEVLELLENPNALMSGNDFIRLWDENMCLFGNAYIYKLNGLSTQAVPSVLNLLPSYDVKIKTTGKLYKQSKLEEIIKNYCLQSNNETFDVNEIIHFHNPNSKNPIQGETPLKPIYMQLSNIRAAMKFRNVAISKHGALGILSNQSQGSDGAIPMTKNERQRIEKQYQKDYGLGDEQSQVLITEANLTWQAMGYPMNQMMVFEEVDENFKCIIDNYGMNENLFSRKNVAKFDNMLEAFKQTYNNTIIPTSEEFSMKLSKEFGLTEKGEHIALDYSGLPFMQEDESKKANVLKLNAESIGRMKESGLFTDEEIRAIFDL